MMIDLGPKTDAKDRLKTDIFQKVEPVPKALEFVPHGEQYLET
jgi:hypothetical protein